MCLCAQVCVCVHMRVCFHMLVHMDMQGEAVDIDQGCRVLVFLGFFFYKYEYHVDLYI